MHLCADAELTFCASVTNSAELQRTNNNNILNTQHTIIHANHNYHVALEGTSQSHRYMTVIDQQRTPMYACEYEPNNWSILYYGQRYDVTWVQPDFGEHSANQKHDFVAPMNGTVVHIPITPPCQIKEGETVMIIEAMKMEHNIVAPCAGKITEVFYQTGALVSGGATVVNFVAEDDL
jgi:3-methylcrotonyl-CoA carboxylase alpha subunit